MDIYEYWKQFETWQDNYDNYSPDVDSLEELFKQAVCELTEARNKIERAKGLAREFIRKEDTGDYEPIAGYCGKEILKLLGE